MSKSPSKTPDCFPVVSLYGDLDESFYQLGLKDRERHKMALTHIESILKVGIPKVDQLINYLTKTLLSQIDAQNLKDFKKHVKAYAEGIDQPVEKVMLAFLTPELFSSLNAWIPGVPVALFGCSSFFARTSKGEMLHGRILDFPLLGSLDLHERGVLFKSSSHDKASLFSYSSAGLPYACLTVQNSHGVTFAIHQKFSKVLNYQGTPMFHAVHEMMEAVETPDQAIELVSSINTMTTWCFLFSFPNGERVVIDKSGKNIFVDRKLLKLGEIEYFANRLLDPTLAIEDALPASMETYNSMREETAKEKIELFLKDHPDFTEVDFLKLMSAPHPSQLKSKKKLNDWKLDTLTPSSLQVVVMNANNKTWHLNPYKAPKLFNGEIVKITDLFDGPKTQLLKSKFKLNQNYADGLGSLMKAQVSWDHSDYHMAYHHIQMSKAYLEETSYKWLPEFYFLVFELITNQHSKNRNLILSQFIEIRPTLPSYHAELCALYINRLEKLLELNSTIDENDFSNATLKALYKAESKAHPIILNQISKFLTKPRIDILDVIHLHVRP